MLKSLKPGSYTLQIHVRDLIADTDSGRAELQNCNLFSRSRCGTYNTSMSPRVFSLFGVLAIGVCAWAGVVPPLPSVSKVRVLSIGVNQYQNPKLRLSFGGADAVAFSEAFRKIGAETPTTLTDAAATRAGIEEALAGLAQQSKTSDTAVFFFSGWGNSGAGGFYLYPSDVARDEDVPKLGISPGVLWAWLDKIQAQNILVILDTGDATDFLAAALMKTLGRSGDNERNLSIIAPQGNSRDDSELGHGVLTDAVLRALTKESDLNGDGLLSVSELEVATSANVIRANSGLSAEVSFRARAVSAGHDFAIGRVGEAKPAAPMRGTQTYAQQNPAPRGTLNGKYRALLIATNEYKEWDRLNNPVPDAEAIAQELESRYGYEKSKLVLNPAKREMSKAITDLRTWQFAPDDELFIFIAGHGTYDPDLKTGYLVATDSEKNDPGHDTYYSQYDLFRNVAAIPAKHVLVVIDACQAGAGLAQLNRDDPKGDITYKPGGKLEGLLDRKDRRSLLWITSGGKEYVPDGEGKHSPFAYQLLSALDSGASDPEGIVTFLDVLGYVQRVHNPAPQPTYGYMPENEHGADFWFRLVAKPELPVQPANRR